MANKVFESILINFEVGGEVCIIEHVPRFGNLEIQGCGMGNKMTLCEADWSVEDVESVIKAFQLMKKRMEEKAV